MASASCSQFDRLRSSSSPCARIYPEATAHERLKPSPALEAFAASAGLLFALKKLPVWVRGGAGLCFIYNGASPDPPGPNQT